MRVVAIVQARLGSSRLPGKSLADLHGRPVIAHVLERVQAMRGLSGVVLAVPSRDYDAFAAAGQWPLFSSADVAESDVLGRFAAAAETCPADAYVRVTGDCPLWAPDVGDLVLERFRDERADYAWNDTLASGWPDGTDVEVFTADLLAMVHRTTPQGVDREHVTPAMRRQIGMRVVTVPASVRHDQKWSIDDHEDFARVAAILSRGPKDFRFASTLAVSR